MAIEIRKAERRKAKLRLGLGGPSGSGKTMGALRLARGMMPNGRVVLIDTERGSGDLYADLYDYDIITLAPPYNPKTYTDAITAAEEAGYDIIIIDSLSHAWNDEGGLLDQADKLSAGGNRFTVWAKLTPQHRALVNSMLDSTAHIIATIRSKQDYAMETDDKGKTQVKKMGMAPIQREGMEYEFTVFIDIDINHVAKTSKDRTNMFKDEVFVIDEKIGTRIMSWLNSGKDDALAHQQESEKKNKVRIIAALQKLDMPSKGDEAKGAVLAIAKLAFAPENLEEIANRLEMAVSQNEENKKEKADEAAGGGGSVSSPAGGGGTGFNGTEKVQI